MPLTYAGPKPFISAHGITFDFNKEDKFIYLSIVAELIQALDHDYIEDKRYTYLVTAKPLDAETIFKLIADKEDNLLTQIEERRIITEKEIEDELQRARENRLLGEEERTVLIRNIELLHSYQVNRALNKTLYYCGIDAIAHEIKKGHIDSINAPMFPKFLHVFHSIQGMLHTLIPQVETQLDIFELDNHLTIQLKILWV
ncbi:MAG: hypothetical protein NTY39_03580 [Campylobacterales bacterium]|nr:hypothetical protein [Campylobacterales bacterium]